MYAEGKPGDEPMPGRTKESVQDLSHEAQITTTCEPPRTRQIPPLPQTTSRNRLRQETTLGPRTSTLERKSIAAAVRQRAYTDPPAKLNNRERSGGSIPRLRTSMAIGAPDGHGMHADGQPAWPAAPLCGSTWKIWYSRRKSVSAVIDAPLQRTARNQPLHPQAQLVILLDVRPFFNLIEGEGRSSTIHREQVEHRSGLLIDVLVEHGVVFHC